jgi:hypothetical protein
MEREVDAAQKNLPLPAEAEFTQLRSRSGSEIRREPRYKCPLASIAYTRLEGGGPGQEIIWLANLSLRGVGFFSEKPFPVGAPLVLRIKALGSHRPEITARVIHSTRQTNGDWLIGCSFDSPMGPEELDACLNDPSTAGPSGDPGK